MAEKKKTAKKYATKKPGKETPPIVIASEHIPILPQAKFFTLTQLVQAWSQPDMDFVTAAGRRRTVRNNTVNKGCPHILFGAETIFLMDSFVEWLRGSEQAYRNGQLECTRREN